MVNMSGDMSLHHSASGSGDLSKVAANLSLTSQRKMNGDGEPLGRFKEAKKRLDYLFSELQTNVDELDQFYNELDSNFADIVTPEQKAEVVLMRDSIRTIRETFRRDNMKVVFFGRTSNGKSTTVNAMLHQKVLPQGMGHTTCCFLQVQGTDEEKGYLLLDDNPTRIAIEKLGQLGHALSSENSDLPAMGQDSLLRVFYPKGSGETENRLLQNDVVILDSPGVDLSPEFDEWIDKHCLDADVFVLVSNAESTLTQAEKNFFLRVAKKLSKPNVFILNNRWDASASELDHVDEVRQQHLTRFRQFLVNELNVCSEKEVKDRIFFVSSREVLDSRLKAKNLISKAYQMDGYQSRALDFDIFEKQFEQCISRSAIQTKFEAHNRRADEIRKKTKSNADSVTITASDRKLAMEQTLASKTDAVKECLANFAQFKKAYEEQKERLRAEVHLKVSADFNEEISRLDAIIDRFNKPFIDTAEGIREYKMALAEFADQCLSADLEARCTGGLMSRIWNLENDMFAYVMKIVDEPYQHKLQEIWQYRAPFKFSICVNVPGLINDFHEDLEFRFTFGVSSIVRRIVAYRSGQPVTAIQTNLLALNPKNATSAINCGDGAVVPAAQQNLAAEENALMTQMVLQSATYIANGSIGLLVVGGVVYRAVGWKVIVTCVSLYGGLYVVERLRWNSSAKEQHLKEQFRSHVAARMQQVAITHTRNCETQSMNEMDQVFNGLSSTVQGVLKDMKNILDVQREEISKIDRALIALSRIKNHTSFLVNQLEEFANNFLRSDSP